MNQVAVFATFTMFVMLFLGSLGLFMSGVAAMRQARLSKRMFKLRFPSDQGEASDSEAN